ncbi:antitoxin VapB family protein [Halorarum salinum]|uniref:Uncharacterized protein n=1 Tax=Halorarum salinum TaxID=2743089 RepID=A0A7D5QDB1_9EURY|nr:hypothetical protein HUG12_09610 [Halobaculum salinum]
MWTGEGILGEAKNISVQEKVYDRLDEQRAPGQSFSGYIEQILNEREED